MDNLETTQDVSASETTTTETQQAPIQDTAPETKVETASESKEAPAWVPNYKVKAYENEYEIPEEFRSYINQENEQKFKEIFGRSFALDSIKQKYKDTLGKYQDVNGKYETVSKNLDRLSKYVQNNDFDSFFSSIKIPEQAIQNWIYQKLQLQDLPQEQRQLYTKNSEYQRELLSMQEQYEEMQAKVNEFEQYKNNQAVQQRHSELESVISSGEYSQLAQNYDAKVGQPGAFKNEVILRAAAVANATGKDLTPAEAVQEFAKLVAWNNQNSAPATNPKAAGRPTIPSVSGKANSPVAPQVKSIDDLKKLAKAASQGQNY